MSAKLAPVQRLPPEMLSEIFLHCIPSNDFPTHESTTIPMLLTRVTHHWRSVALSTPQLWAQICPVFSSFRRSNMQPSLVTHFLERSGNCPLSIRLDGRVEDFIAAVIPHARRWYAVALCMPLELFSYLRPIRHELVSLRALSVTAYNASPEGEPIDIFASVPRLRSVGLCIYPQNFIIACNRLTTCELHFDTARNCLAILRQAPNLVECKLSESFAPDGDPRPLRTPVTSRLRSLMLVHIYQHGWPYFFSNVTLPSVRKVKVALVPHYISEWSYTRLGELLARSAAPLEELHLQNVRTSSLDLIQCLAYLPSLYILKLSGECMPFNDAVLARMTYDPQLEHPPLTPNLHTLELQLSAPLPFSPKALVTMLESRLRIDGAHCAVRRLNSVVVNLPDVELSDWHIEKTELSWKGGFHQVHI